MHPTKLTVSYLTLEYQTYFQKIYFNKTIFQYGWWSMLSFKIRLPKKIGPFQNNIISIKITCIGQVCGEVNAKQFPPSVRFYNILMCDDEFCGLHYSAWNLLWRISHTILNMPTIFTINSGHRQSKWSTLISSTLMGMFNVLYNINERTQIVFHANPLRFVEEEVFF